MEHVGVGTSDRQTTKGTTMMPYAKRAEQKVPDPRNVLRDRLEFDRRELLARAGLASGAATEPTATTGFGETEHIASGIDRGVWAALDAHAASRLAEVEAALRRLEARAYGRCERCAGDIPDERLDAMPEVRFCMPCQQRDEAERRVLQPQ
jgi:DnaK suppressor protein